MDGFFGILRVLAEIVDLAYTLSEIMFGMVFLFGAGGVAFIACLGLYLALRRLRSGNPLGD